VRGGIVLNRYVGGLNPAAVEAAFRLGGRCVWFPTIDADAHARAFGSTGAYPAQRGGVESPSGIRVLDGAGRCVPEALEVLELAAEPVGLSRDAGQAESPPPPESLQAFAQSLHEAGVPEGELRKALVETPTRLLDR